MSEDNDKDNDRRTGFCGLWVVGASKTIAVRSVDRLPGVFRSCDDNCLALAIPRDWHSFRQDRTNATILRRRRYTPMPQGRRASGAPWVRWSHHAHEPQRGSTRTWQLRSQDPVQVGRELAGVEVGDLVLPVRSIVAEEQIREEPINPLGTGQNVCRIVVMNGSR